MVLEQKENCKVKYFWKQLGSDILIVKCTEESFLARGYI